MVSFKTLIFPLVTLAALAQAHAGNHVHHRRYRYNGRRYYNGTETTNGLLGTGVETTELPTHTVDTTLAPIFTPPAVENPVTTCITKYETKTYTYTLGNGKAHTTTVIHTNVITQTVTPVPEPTKEGSVEEYVPGGSGEEHPEYTSEYTSTSTTTVLLTITRTLPLPNETKAPVFVEENPGPEAPCPVSTVYVTVPVSVIKETVVQTVKETVMETITVTQTPVSEHAPVYTPPVYTPPVYTPPVYSPPAVHPPYSNHSSNHTTTETAAQVTLTVVPVPYN